MEKFFFPFLLLGLHFVQCKSQPIAFEKIEYALFDVNSYRTNVKDSAFVGLYCSITSEGIVRIKNPGDIQDSPKVHYSFRLSASELEKINSIFNSKKLLKVYLVKTKLDENSMYAGSYDFYRVSYPNGVVDSICLIMPFVSKSFQDLDDLLSNIFYSRKGRSKIDQFDIPIDFFASLKECYLKSTYLPEIKTLPSFKLHN